MTNVYRVKDFLKEHQNAYCDDCLSAILKIYPRQQVNQICRERLRGEIRREEAECFECHKYKVVNWHEERKNIIESMDTLYVTYCSGKKDEKEESIPAIESYDSDRIRWVYNLSIKANVKFAILSGVLGLVKPDEKIPYYNHKMNKDDVERIAKLIKWFLMAKKCEKIVYFTENPHSEPILKYYHASLKKAIDELNEEEEQNINLDLKMIQKRSYEEIELPNPEDLFLDDNSED